MLSLGDLWRASGFYNGNEALTRDGDSVLANPLQIEDARKFAQLDDQGRGFNYWLTLILCLDNRIPFTPYDEEEINT
jgi:hypothetical protein